MNMERYTERVKQIMQSAQADALLRNHTVLTPWHILSVMLADGDDAAVDLIATRRR